MERVRGLRSSFNQGIRQRLESAAVKVICAEASFVDERTVKGGDAIVQAPLVIINTGTSSLTPNIPGLAGTPYLTNRNFFDLKELPPRLLVLGAGYIGLELGQGLARLGSQTQFVVRGDRVLNQEELEGMTLEQAQKKGINARAVTLPMSHIARAIEWGHDLGFYRMVIDSDSDKILGATLVGYETAELVHVFLDLMEAGATWQLLERSVHIHPTYGEALPSLARLLLGNMPGCPNM